MRHPTPPLTAALLSSVIIADEYRCAKEHLQHLLNVGPAQYRNWRDSKGQGLCLQGLVVAHAAITQRKHLHARGTAAHVAVEDRDLQLILCLYRTFLTAAPSHLAYCSREVAELVYAVRCEDETDRNCCRETLADYVGDAYEPKRLITGEVLPVTASGDLFEFFAGP